MIYRLEFKKIIENRFVIISFLLIFLLNAFVAYRQAKQTEAEEPAPGKILADFYEEYISSPDEIDAYYDELKEYRKSQAKVKKAAEEAGIEFIETRQSRLTEGLYTDDIDIIDRMRVYAAECTLFPNEIEKYIKNAEINKKEFLKSGYPENSYEVRNQAIAGWLYEQVQKNVTLKPVFINGWDDFYSFSLAGVLSALVSIIIGAAGVVFEKDTGMLPIMKTTRFGRKSTIASKLAVAVILSALAAVLLTAESMAVFAVFEGFSGGTEAIQALSAFRKSFLIISIRGYLPVLFLQRIAASILIAVVSVLISVCFYNYVLTFASSAAIIGINLALFSIGNDIYGRAAGYLNLYSLIEGTRLFSRYSSLNLFGKPLDYYLALAVATVLLILIFCFLAVCFFCRTGTGIEIGVGRKLKNLWRHVREIIKKQRKKAMGTGALSKTTSIFRHECYKQTVASRMGIIALVVVAAGLALFSRSAPFSEQSGYSEKLYYKYISDYAGEWTEEKHDSILELKERYDKVIADHAMMELMLSQGAITSEEYIQHNRDFVIARREIDSVNMLLDHSRYLKKQLEKTGVRGSFLDDRGWQAYIFRGPDYCLLAAILIIFSGSFSAEYGIKSMSVIIHAAPRGRTAVFVSKTQTVVLISVGLRLLSEIPTIAMCAGMKGMPLPEASAVSVEKLSELNTDISLCELAGVIILIRLLSAVFLGIVVMAVSCITRRAFSAIVTTASVAFIPAICDYSGMKFWAGMDFLKLFEGGRLVLASIASEESPDFRLVILVLIMITVASAILTVISGIRFGKKS